MPRPVPCAWADIFVDGDPSGRTGTGRFAQLDAICGSLIHASQRRSFPRIPVYDINGAGRWGGVVVRASSGVRIKCLYGADATSWNIPGGCAEGVG